MATIGVLTYHWVANFGANLQALSTVGYIRKTGHNPIIINWIPEDLQQYYHDNTMDEQIKVHADFQKYYGTISKLCRNIDDVVSVIKENNLDLIIIGSDAVLTYVPVIDRFVLSRTKGIAKLDVCVDSDFPNPYWGEFLEKVNVHAALMSVSAQNTKYRHIYKRKKFANILKKFDYISVRDTWTQNMIKYLTRNKLNPDITPDPVFSFNANIDSNLIIRKEELLKKYHLPEKYVLITLSSNLFSDEWLLKLSSLFSSSSITLFSLPKANKTKYKIKCIDSLNLPIPPLDWYYLIKYSSGYIGELMHPILVSLHNAVPIYSIDTYGFKKKGKFDTSSSKIYHILNRFNLLDHTYNINSNEPIPTPSFVYDKIMSFNAIKCMKESEKCQIDYDNMMTEILKLVR